MTSLPVENRQDREANPMRSVPLNQRLGAAGGFAFVAIVVAQNLARFAISPDNDAPPSEIVASFVDHRTLYMALGTSLAASGVALALFLGSLWDRVSAGESRTWAQVGFLGGTGIFATFPMMVAAEFGLVTATHGAEPNLDVVATIWVIHNAIFAVLNLSIAVATIGFAMSSSQRRLVPAAFRWIGSVAGILLLAGTMGGTGVTAGDSGPVMGLAGLGFLGWLSLVLACSRGMLRS